jgi:hypothetical protein
MVRGTIARFFPTLSSEEPSVISNQTRTSDTDY